MFLAVQPVHFRQRTRAARARKSANMVSANMVCNMCIIITMYYVLCIMYYVSCIIMINIIIINIIITIT